jgi:hypothetical protein
LGGGAAPAIRQTLELLELTERALRAAPIEDKLPHDVRCRAGARLDPIGPAP